jgi:hypothetical protein
MREKIIKIQNKLNVPKNQRNTFGNYNYRSCEDILEALKPLLKEEGLLLTITDELVNIGERYYVKATVKVSDGTKDEIFTAYAREEETKKGMDGSQITGASSSYARKYALNGLFLIDDNKDSDATNTHESTAQNSEKQQVTVDNSTVPACPKCGGMMWDNRQNKTNPKAPDFKCKDPNCKDEKGYVTAVWEPEEKEIDIDEIPPFN